MLYTMSTEDNYERLYSFSFFAASELRNKELMHRFIGASSYARSQHRHLSKLLVIFELIKWTNSTHNSSQLHLETSFTAMSLQW